MSSLPRRGVSAAAALVLALAPGALYASHALAADTASTPAVEVDDATEVALPGTGASLTLTPPSTEAETVDVADTDADEAAVELPDASSDDQGANNDEQDATATESKDATETEDATDTEDATETDDATETQSTSGSGSDEHATSSSSDDGPDTESSDTNPESSSDDSD